MNIPMIRYILCQVMRIEGVLMLLPSLISIIYGDGEGMYYGIVAGVLIISGFIGCRFVPKDQNINVKEGCRERSPRSRMRSSRLRRALPRQVRAS